MKVVSDGLASEVKRRCACPRERSGTNDFRTFQKGLSSYVFTNPLLELLMRTRPRP